MSSRRKRAPPMKVDEERQQQLCWNMHEDLRNEPLSLTEEERACSDADSSDCIIIDDDPPDGAAHRDKKRCTETVSILDSTEKETLCPWPLPFLPILPMILGKRFWEILCFSFSPKRV